MSPWSAPLRRQGVGVHMRLDTVILAAGTVRIATPGQLGYLSGGLQGIDVRAGSDYYAGRVTNPTGNFMGLP